MRVELRKSGGPVCQTCGSYPLIAILRSPDADPEPLLRELPGLFPAPPWWRPSRRKWHRQMVAVLEGVETELLDAGRYPIAPTAEEVGEVLVDRS